VLPGAHALLEVPFLPQPPELCGGAAVAMVLRYWGERRVMAQDFASLVSAGDGGIVTGTLAAAVRERGWQTLIASVGDDPHARMQADVDRGRPVIALIEVAPRSYHYVVIVGLTDQDVVLHDPARSPFRVVRWAEFDRAWAAAGRWAMVVLPPVGMAPADSATPAATAPPGDQTAAATPCAALVARGVDLAHSGDTGGAERSLVASTALCPDLPAAWRELAGLRFSQSRWSEAQALALAAVQRAPDDAYAWQLVATSRYLTGDVSGALAAWNRAREPHIDTVDVHGVERTPHPVVVRAAGLQPRQILTPATFGRALRRLRELPVAASASIRYEPLDDGLVRLEVSINERQVVPRGWAPLVTIGARAALLHELRVEVAGPLGAGERATVAWRWSPERPRLAFGFTLPSPQWFSGVLSVEGVSERQSYGVAPAPDRAALAREGRRRLAVGASDWAASWLRWQTGLAVERVRDERDPGVNPAASRDFVAVEGALEARLADDRFAVGASGRWWAPMTGGDHPGSADVLLAWRSTDDATRPSWSAVTTVEVASRAAPFALWPGAGTGQGRRLLLRAHPLLTGDVLTGEVFGRRVASGSFEYLRPLKHTLAGGLSVAGFIDTARAWYQVNGGSSSPTFIDAGVGLRVHAPGPNGAIRLDVAHGLRGGGTTLSASWGGVWPR
jgi:hypothetical protein